MLSREMTVREHLEFLAQLPGHDARSGPARYRARAVAVCPAGPGRPAGWALSHGQGKRVGVAQAFLGDPELILLDEPTAGLDPRNAHELRQAIVSERGRRTVVVSSHNLQELEAICDEAAFIERGQTVDGGRLSELTSQDREVTVYLGKADAGTPLLTRQTGPSFRGLPGAEAQLLPADLGGRPTLRCALQSCDCGERHRQPDPPADSDGQRARSCACCLRRGPASRKCRRAEPGAALPGDHRRPQLAPGLGPRADGLRISTCQGQLGKNLYVNPRLQADHGLLPAGHSF